MKRLVLALPLIAVLFAQKPKDPVPECHMNGAHPCHCMERTNKIQNAATAVCNSGDWRSSYKTIADCYADKLAHMDHCSVAEAWTLYDEPSGDTEIVDGRDMPLSKMGPVCSGSCTRHHCLCDGDGPMCHFSETKEQVREEYAGK